MLAAIGDWLTKRERAAICALMQSVTDSTLQGARVREHWNLPFWNAGCDTRSSWEIAQDPQFYVRAPQPGGYAFDAPHRCATVPGLHRHASHDYTSILYLNASDDPKNAPPHDPVTGEVRD